MKKRILSILLTLCMVLMLVPTTVFADDDYTLCRIERVFAHGDYLTYTNGYLEEELLIGTIYTPGKISNCAPYEFLGWKDELSGDSTLIAPDQEIKASRDARYVAVYKLPAPSIDILISGYELGNTPGECMIENIMTTIPDLDFNGSDTLQVEWGRIDQDGMPHSMSETEVFEADTTYTIHVVLKDKALESDLAAKVNGKTATCVVNDGKITVDYQFDKLTAPLTIHGPNEVCAQQDYEFTVTPPAGVTITGVTFGDDYMGSEVELIPNEDGVLSGVVRASGFAQFGDSFKLTVYGTADGTPVTATKTVQVSQKHIYVDGVCGCGAVQTYTVQYDGGAEFGLCVDVKTYGEDLTLLGETFKREGYVQTGWVDKETGKVYKLGDTYTENADVTLNPVYDKLITLTVPFTTTVALGDVGVPGETTFDLEIVGANAGEETYEDVTVSASVTTNGAGSYEGTMTLTGPFQQLRNMLCEGAFVKQVDAGEANWTYDDTVWGLLLTEVVALASTDDAAPAYSVLILPTVCEETDDGVRYDIDWDSIDWDDLQSEDMCFTNTYTAHAYELKYDETDHWDECSCGDVQNKEAHQYGEWTVTREATETAAGEKEHTCTVCGYTETAEIAKLTEKDSPQTGDNSNLTLWLALFAVSAAGVIGTGVYSKRRRRSRAK